MRQILFTFNNPLPGPGLSRHSSSYRSLSPTPPPVKLCGSLMYFMHHISLMRVAEAPQTSGMGQVADHSHSLQGRGIL